jgi:hypothetical protein
MASLRFRDKSVLEGYLEMGGGYVLNFSDRTFAEFFRDFDVDIDDPEYLRGHSGSKANRMRSFWDSAPDAVVGNVLEELVEYTESSRPGHSGADQVRAIATRLRGAQLPAAPLASVRPPAPPATNSQGIRTSASPRNKPIEIFFSYAHEEEALMDVVRLHWAEADLVRVGRSGCHVFIRSRSCHSSRHGTGRLSRGH